MKAQGGLERLHILEHRAFCGGCQFAKYNNIRSGLAPPGLAEKCGQLLMFAGSYATISIEKQGSVTGDGIFSSLIVKGHNGGGYMDDSVITELYWQRDERAINESRSKYGAYCSTIADNILHSAEDTEECVNETWLKAWNAIPPERPSRLSAFLGKITRNLAIDRYRRDRSGRCGGGQTALCLDELGECTGGETAIEDRLALRELLNIFLRGLPEKNRDIFLLRYWYMMPVAEIAKRNALTEGAVKMILQRVRKKLKKYLEKEGVYL